MAGLTYGRYVAATYARGRGDFHNRPRRAEASEPRPPCPARRLRRAQRAACGPFLNRERTHPWDSRNLKWLCAGLATACMASAAWAADRPTVVVLYDRRRRLVRLWLHQRRRRGARSRDTQHRPPGQGRHLLHELVRPGELHRRAHVVHDRAHPDPHRDVGRRRAGRREHDPQGDPTIAEFFKKNGYQTVLLGQVAHGRQA